MSPPPCGLVLRRSGSDALIAANRLRITIWLVSRTTFHVARTGRSAIASLVTVSIASLGKYLPGQTVGVAARWAWVLDRSARCCSAG